MRQIRQQSGRAESRCAAGAGGAEIAEAEVDAVVMERYGAGAIAGNNLYQYLVHGVGVDGAAPRAENAEVANEEAIAVRRTVDDAVQWRGEVVVRIAHAQPE